MMKRRVSCLSVFAWFCVAYGAQEELIVSPSKLEEGVERAIAQPRYVEQLQDHFDPFNQQTWWQTYYVNDTFWAGPASSAPVFFCVGGEGPPIDASVVSSSVHCNNAVEWLEETGAIMFALEHRYYSCHNMSACPVNSFDSVQDYKYLSAEQALEDIANFHEQTSKLYQLHPDTKWVVFGGSYPGMLAAWSRLKYPHLFHIAVASSAPVHAQLEMRGYNDVVAEAYATESVGGSQLCRQRIAQGHAMIGEMFKSQEGRARLTALFHVDSLETFQQQRSFSGNGVAEFPAQSNDPVCTSPACNIDKICRIMTQESTSDPVQALAEVRRQQQQRRRQLQIKADLWDWQVCTEFGFLQTCEVGSKCMYTQGLVNLTNLFEETCTPYQVTDMNQLRLAIDRKNTRYGGVKTDVERILWVDGNVDPWIALSIQRLSPFQLHHGQALLVVEGASHHAWTHPSSSDDQPSVQQARKKIRTIVSQWLRET